MRSEYLRHGFSSSQVYSVSFPYFDPSLASNHVVRRRPTSAEAPQPWRLLFLGRFDFLKGGLVLLDALPQVTRALDSAIHITFAGDGPERESWEKKAAAIQRADPNVHIQ